MTKRTLDDEEVKNRAGAPPQETNQLHEFACSQCVINVVLNMPSVGVDGEVLLCSLGYGSDTESSVLARRLDLYNRSYDAHLM